jgi:excinuclease ABC subunit A
MPFAGVIADLEKSYHETESDGFRARLSTYMVSGPCPECHGTRLSARSSAVTVRLARTETPTPKFQTPDKVQAKEMPNAKIQIPKDSVASEIENQNSKIENALSFPAFMALDVAAAHDFARELVAAHGANDALREVVTGIEQRLHFLLETGLGYLTLDRDYSSLSGGEAQRVRLATQLGMGLIGVIYVLDEPSIGLHPADNERLLQQLRTLRDRGNTVLVVEHDAETMLAADEIIELGPEAGVEGGQLLFQGSPAECLKLPQARSHTGPYLARRLSVMKDFATKTPDGAWLTVREARQHNLRGIDAKFPVGLLTCVTGVSGSGKSTLVNDILAAAAARKLNGAKHAPRPAPRHRESRPVREARAQVDQEPIGRSPRSNPATFVGLLDLLRDLFAKVPLAKVRGYKASRFSFNVRGGRCERCQGDGVIKLDMQFMADAYAPCPSCAGRRFNRETLEVLFHGRSIADVLALTVREAITLFRNIPRIVDKLATLDAVGLGYLTLGQPAPTLSGGEAQRLKLSLELSKRQQGETLYILDEPTTGLHWIDIQKLMDLLFRLRDAGNTIIVIEHNLDVINLADWLIDLGPGGGKRRRRPGLRRARAGRAAGAPGAPPDQSWRTGDRGRRTARR